MLKSGEAPSQPPGTSPALAALVASLLWFGVFFTGQAYCTQKDFCHVPCVFGLFSSYEGMWHHDKQVDSRRLHTTEGRHDL